MGNDNKDRGVTDDAGNKPKERAPLDENAPPNRPPLTSDKPSTLQDPTTHHWDNPPKKD